MNDFFRLESLVMQFGGLTAVKDFSLSIEPGELVGLIGPNGAGKTTVFNMITGFLTPTSGRVLWQGEDITGLSVHQITARGIARTFQNIRLFSDMTVLENVMVSFHHKVRSRFWKAMLGLPSHGKEERRIRQESYRFLQELNLGHLADEKAGNLAYGQQRRLEIARALATYPKLLLLDEPAAGMNPQETMELADLVLEIRQKHALTIFLIEHDMKFVMGLCERIKVLDYGISIAEGTPEEIQSNPDVIKAYLGEPKHA
ncbi:amino acid/amide ABC transporter ATP-binding protein 1, HAAT family [Desulfacinum hydrothermale DSM 13146]|uniref:Amino acid/amide ABC transporter ATP-binding protein 1, HAAT family n=1 Tax=Desulfacinum hydrothermale DSM 13146 TaxID=1121390 RepID=A0A1W1X582_9BACT|nr:ABC transporter ATP-binding protein [Desulfacinum hydrothermale]SMC18963.1 amino acid/amide ABC transporter ATP-binding protein 1, HAAT family [Desulfacinum hydrothermale DSM 13146]